MAQDFDKKIAQLEFVNDQLITEIEYIDTLLKEIGFPAGLETIKQAARELKEHRDCQDF